MEDHMTELTPFTRQNAQPTFWRDFDYDPFTTYKRDFGWSPFASFKREVDRLFSDFFRTPAYGRFADYPYGYSEYAYGFDWPKIDFKESEDEILVTAEVPGMTEKDVELYFDKGVFTIRGFRKGEQDESGYSERFYGRFERKIPMPYSVDGDHCSAEFVNGLLTVHFPKLAEKDNKKKIPVGGTTHH